MKHNIMALKAVQYWTEKANKKKTHHVENSFNPHNLSAFWNNKKIQFDFIDIFYKNSFFNGPIFNNRHFSNIISFQVPFHFI